jgi:hypothetical protein
MDMQGGRRNADAEQWSGFLSPANAEEETATTKEPQTSHESNKGENGSREQEEVEEGSGTFCAS